VNPMENLVVNPIEGATETPRTINSKRGLYEALAEFCFRAPTLPIANGQETFPASDLNVKDPILRYALAIASPDLVTALDRANTEGNKTEADGIRRKLLRYTIRMRSRSTPFGLFAGVAMARWGPKTNLTLNGINQVRIRPDMEWLGSVIRKLEKRDVIRRNLRWMTNPASFVGGGRVYLEERSSAVPGGGSLRATPAVMRALDAAREPIRYPALVDRLTLESGPEERDHIEQILGRLLEHGLMYTDLMPSPNISDPLQHVIRKLHPIPQAKTMCLRLEVLREAIRRCEAAEPAKALEPHQYAVAQAKLIAKDGPANPLQSDCSLSLGGGQIHREVARRAALAAEVLLRLSGQPQSQTPIMEYRQSFLARYGRHREVPLLELLSRDWGLGPLREATQGSSVPSGATSLRRADAVQQLALRAVHNRELRVVLDDAMLARLEREPLDASKAPLSLDVHVSVIAEEAQAIDHGKFLLAIGPGPGVTGAGRFLGRFTDLFEQDINHLRRTAADREQQWSSERIVDLNYLPDRLRAANVCLCPVIRDYHTTYGAISCVDDGTSIPLNEIMVSLRDDRFLMRWSRGECFVRFCAGHMFNVGLAPQVIRFLFEASQDGVVHMWPFDWGACAGYPMLPRLEYKGIVLSPTKWRLKAPTLAGTVREEDVRRYIMGWRTHWNVPREVYLSQGDNRLLLDLDDPEQLTELVEEVRKLRPNTVSLVEEALPGAQHAWVKGPDGSFISELVVSLIRRDSTNRESGFGITVASAPGFSSPSREHRLKAPGEDWVYLKAYVPAGLQDEALRGPVRELCSDIARSSQIYKWFFIRYADPNTHLRLRFQGPKEWLNREWLPGLLAWGKALIDAGLCEQIALDTYDREIERYGGLASIDSVETLFHFDSLSVLKLLEYAAMNRADVDMKALAVATLDDFYMALAPDAATAVCWLRKLTVESRKVVGDQHRKLRATLFAYAGDRCSSDPPLAEVLRERRAAITRIGQELRVLESSGALCVSMENICASLAHMHLNRLFPMREFDEPGLMGLLARTRESLSHRGTAEEVAAAVAGQGVSMR